MKAVLVFFVALLACSNAIATDYSHKELPADAAKALSDAKSAVIYSLEPAAKYFPDKYPAGGKKFHDFLVLGKATLNAEQTRKAASIYRQAIEDWKNGDHGVSGCMFEPRHALRIESNGHVYDFVACYHCGQLEVYDGDKQIVFMEIRGSPDTLNGILTDAHVPLSKTSH